MSAMSETHVTAGHSAVHATRVAQDPTEHALHVSLVRPVLYFGVERPVVAFEGTLVAGLLFSVGPHLVTLIVAAIVVLVIHPTMAWLTARDPQITEVYLRSRAYADYYAPHVSVTSRRTPPRVRASVPSVR
jgi:type IV secretory pathway TrbD component